MMRQKSLIRRVLGVVRGIALIVALLVVYNVWLWLSEGSPTIPQLEGRWWAGYYETTHFGQQWCVARFVKSQAGRLQMARLSAWGEPDIFDVDRSTSTESIVYRAFTEPQNALRIEAKQLYTGK